MINPVITTERTTMKYFYTTGSNCTSSLSAVDACMSQSNNNIIYKYMISSSGDFFPSSSQFSHLNSTRMSERCAVKNEDVPMIIVYHYGNIGEPGLEITRWQEKPKRLQTQDNINAVFNHYSSSGG